MVKFKELDFLPGEVTYDTFDVNQDIPFEDQIDELREDLFQVSYGGEKYTIDIGWLPGGNPKGNFVVTLISGYDWEEPIYQKRTNDWIALNKCVEESVKIVRRLLTKR